MYHETPNYGFMVKQTLIIYISGQRRKVISLRRVNQIGDEAARPLQNSA